MALTGRAARNMARRRAGTTARATAARSSAAAKKATAAKMPALNAAQKARVKGSQFYKNHKKLVIGGGALAIAGTAFSNNTGVGSSKSTPNQARGMYGF